MTRLIQDDRFGELVTAFIVTQLGNVLRDTTRYYTVFAPTDLAFRNAPQGIVSRILDDKTTLESMYNKSIPQLTLIMHMCNYFMV